MFKGETHNQSEVGGSESRRLAAAEVNDPRRMNLVVIVRADKTAEATTEAKQADKLVRKWVRSSVVSLLLGGKINGWIKADAERLTEIVAEINEADTWQRQAAETETEETATRQMKAPAVLWVRRSEDGGVEYLRGIEAENLDNLVTKAQFRGQLRWGKGTESEEDVWTLEPIKLGEITGKIFG